VLGIQQFNASSSPPRRRDDACASHLAGLHVSGTMTPFMPWIGCTKAKAMAPCCASWRGPRLWRIRLMLSSKEWWGGEELAGRFPSGSWGGGLGGWYQGGFSSSLFAVVLLESWGCASISTIQGPCERKLYPHFLRFFSLNVSGLVAPIYDLHPSKPCAYPPTC